MSDIREKIVHWLRGYEIKHESQVSSPSPHTRAADEIELLETERDEAWAECDRLRAELAASKLDRGSVDAARQRISELTRDGDIGMARRWLGNER